MTETYLDRIGGLIRDARKHRGLTQTQLADVLGTSQSAVHRIEAGNQNLSLEMVNRIAEALDFWRHETLTIAPGTIVERYWLARKLALPVPPTIRMK